MSEYDIIKSKIKELGITEEYFSDNLINSWEKEHDSQLDITNLAQFVIDKYKSPLDFLDGLERYLLCMDNTNEPIKNRKVGRPKGSRNTPLTDEEKRIKKNKYNRLQREYYRRKVVLNPTKIRQSTKEENARKKRINERQMLLQTESGTDKKESESKV